MDTNANTITTMGNIANEVYDNDYFNGKLTEIEGKKGTGTFLKR